MKPTIGFIGQGYVGKSYADNFEDRGFKVIRYSRQKHVQNKENLKNCDIIFIAVPTPTTPQGFDISIVEEVLTLVPKGKIAVIKSTLLPGTTEKLQKKFPDISVLHSPEFLTESTARYDADHPNRNIIGYVREKDYQAAVEVMKILPPAPHKAILPVRTAELIKYGGNCWFYLKVVYVNMLYDLSQKLGINYEDVKHGLSYDPRIGYTHLDPLHKSGGVAGGTERGAGGHCFIKDFAAFAKMYSELMPEDKEGQEMLKDLQAKNNRLLIDSNKDLDLLESVYGDLE